MCTLLGAGEVIEEEEEGVGGRLLFAAPSSFTRRGREMGENEERYMKEGGGEEELAVRVGVSDVCLV